MSAYVVSISLLLTAASLVDTTGLADLVPLGGASVLLVYLLRLIGDERRRWIKERAELVQECHEELDRKRQLMDRREADQERHLAQWRERYDVLRADYDRLLELHEQSAKRERKEGADDHTRPD